MRCCAIDVCKEYGVSFIITSETNAPIRRRLTDSELVWLMPNNEKKQGNQQSVLHKTRSYS